MEDKRRKLGHSTEATEAAKQGMNEPDEDSLRREQIEREIRLHHSVETAAAVQKYLDEVNEEGRAHVRTSLSIFNKLICIIFTLFQQ